MAKRGLADLDFCDPAGTAPSSGIPARVVVWTELSMRSIPTSDLSWVSQSPAGSPSTSQWDLLRSLWAARTLHVGL